MDVAGTMGTKRPVDYDFAVGANRACYFRTIKLPMTMDFDPEVLMRPVRTLSGAHITNTLWKKVRKSEPEHVFVHEQSMDFVVNDLPSGFD